MASGESRENKSVLLLKAAKGGDDPYAAAFREAGFTPHYIPVLHFDFLNSEQLAAALMDSKDYSGLVFTSQTAVDASCHALSTHSPPDWHERLSTTWKDLPTFVVGKATAQAVEDKLGLKASGSVSGNAEALSKVIIEHFSEKDKSSMKQLLFPCSSLRRETLPAAMEQAGIPLHCLTSYNTVAAPRIAENIHSLFQKQDLSGEVWVVYFSPSGVSYARDHIERVSKNHKVAAIGPTTAEALTKIGTQVDVTASKPNAQSLAQAISTHNS